MLPAKSKKYDQPYDQPDQKSQPISYSKLSHEIKIRQETDHRDQCQLFPYTYKGEDNCRQDEKDKRKFAPEKMPKENYWRLA